MKTDLLRLRAITHLSDAQALEITKQLNAMNFRQQPERRASISPTRKRGIENIKLQHIQSNEPDPNNNQQFVKSQQLQRRNSGSNANLQQSFIDSFNKNIEVDKLKEEVSRLWYEKLALQNTVQKLNDENNKKDDIIRSLQAQIGGQSNFRHSALPGY